MLIDTVSLELYTHPENWKENGQLVLNKCFFILRDFCFKLKDFLNASQPYRLRVGRVVIIKKGSADYAVNLVDHHFVAGDIVVFLSDTLIEKRQHSDDFEVHALSFDYDSPWLPDLGIGFFYQHMDDYTKHIVMQHFDILWQMANEAPVPVDNIRMLFSSFLLFVHRQAKQPSVTPPANRGEEVLRRFVTEVSHHAAQQRNVPFYANLLCLDPHYLSTIIKQASGRTVMQWINQTAVKEAKVWLAYSDENVSQIAIKLNFPDTASFTKFFKRETGLTPSAYRNSQEKA